MAVLTIKHYNDSIDSFVKNITDSSKSYYIFIGKPDPWPDEQNPPAANTSIHEYQQTIYDDLVYGKKIGQYDVAYMIPKHVWTSNTIYDRYDQNDANLYTKKFYVVTDKREVYKCINNNYNNPSSVKPDLPLPYSSFNTSDGYTWKYMYTIDINYNGKFTTNDYIPIAANSIGSTYDVNVRGNTVNGTIDAIIVNYGGENFQTYTSGFLKAFVNNNVVQLANNASQYNNFYTDSTIYLKSGFGSGQLRKISSYNGLTKQIGVTTPFESYRYFELTGINGINNINAGQTVTQRFENLAVNFISGYFNNGDTIIQTDDSNNSNNFAIGTIVSSNSTTIKVVTTTPNSFLTYAPVYVSSQAGIQRLIGDVYVTSGSNTVTGVSTVFKDVANTANSQYQVGQYIRVGNNANTNIRRITSIASNTSLQVDYPFNVTLVANTHYLMPVAANPTSVTISQANGVITNLNLTGVQLNISNVSILGLNFFVGEIATMVDSANVSQLANGTVAYSNSSTVILSNVQGPSFQSGYFLLGSSSLQKANIDFVTSNPNITVSDPRGEFINGQILYFRPTANLSQSIANATLVSSYIIPNELTEYVISPTVEIDGDGDGAIAYTIVNAQSNSIGSVVVVNTGSGYTYANINIVANNQFGGNADLTSVIAPVRGHGYDPTEELGSRYVSISTTFDDIQNENYVFPGYGSYRRIGIIKDPLYDDVTINMDSFDRAQLTVNNTSGYSFSNGEIVLQTMTNAAAVVSVYDSGDNSAFLELKNIRGDWAANGQYANGDPIDDTIYGLSSGASANVLVYEVNRFTLGSNVELVSEIYSGGTGRIKQVVNNTQIKLTDVSGRFDANDIVYSETSNAYANVTSIFVSNNTTDESIVFGDKFNQTARVTLSSSYGFFHEFEYIEQSVTDARGKILSSNSELDIEISSPSGSFTLGDTVFSTNTNANGIVTFANSSYLKMTSVNGDFYVNDTINNGVETATVDAVYKVLLLTDVSDVNKFQSSSLYSITGTESGAYGFTTIANTINYPDLVRESGSVIYLENVEAFTRSNTSNEKISLIIKF